MTKAKPLVLDVDGTFLNTDMLFECFWAGLGNDPLRTIGVCLKNLTNPAKLKQELADVVDLRLDLLPVNQEIKALADEGIAAGREVVLASASHQPLVNALAAEHDLSTRTFASDGETNLKGAAKATALVIAYGEEGFDYAGNENVDRAIWDHCDSAIVVGDLPATSQHLVDAGKTVISVHGGWKARELLRAIRPHQWVKNVLLLLPMIAAHQFSLNTLFLVLWGIVAFSAAASSIYIVNDLLDLEADRLHDTKKNRPFASGTVPIKIGMMAFVGLAAIALGIGVMLGWLFFGVVAAYMTLSLAYSLKLKRMRWVDIAVLASLYTIRVVAGAAAGMVYVSGFMLVFIFPIFITLGCVKRMTELKLAKTDERLPGRGYGRTDIGDILNVAGLGTVGALLIFFAYSFTEQAIDLYNTQWILWLALLPIAMWLIRMVRLGYFGKMDYDPIVFAMRDKRGLGLLMIVLSMMFYAAGLWAEWFGLG